MGLETYETVENQKTTCAYELNEYRTKKFHAHDLIDDSNAISSHGTILCVDFDLLIE